MIEDITPGGNDRMSSVESQFHTERQVPTNIRGIRANTRPNFYKQSGMAGNAGSMQISGGNLEGYVPGATISDMYSNQNSSYHPAPSGDYGTYTENVLEHTPELPALTERYESSVNCVDVADHTANCPVCSQLYSSDNTVMYIIIAVLVLIIALMFVKLLDRK